MDRPQQHKLASEQEPNRLIQLGMYMLAAGAGIATASFNIWTEFYSKIKHTDLIRRESDKRYEQINDIYNAAQNNHLTHSEFHQKITAVETAYSAKVDALLEHVGVEKARGPLSAIRSTLQRAEALGPYTRTNILAKGMIATGTTLGGYFLVNQNWRLKNELRDVHAKLDNQQQR